MQAVDLTLDDAKVLLERMKKVSAPVKANRLGFFGDAEEIRFAMPNYAKVLGTFKLTSDGEVAEIPYVIESWAKL
jgi:hypothetical protein